jgi:hypothetical protein
MDVKTDVTGHSVTREVTACPGCGLVLPEADAPTHAYIGSSAACWALFGRLLEREFGDATLFRAHHLTVDAYAAQHPGVVERRAIQSVAVHLMALCLHVEEGVDPSKSPGLRKRMADGHEFRWLDPPRLDGVMTVADVLRARAGVEHCEYAEAWARSVWQAWSCYHHVVREWVARALG